MKILMATMGLDIGGAETHIVELAKELRHQGHEVVVVSNGGVYVPEITAAGIRHYNAPMHRRSLGDMLRSRAILRDVISQEKPDVVHAPARIPAFLCGTLQRRMEPPGLGHGVACRGRSSGGCAALQHERRPDGDPRRRDSSDREHHSRMPAMKSVTARTAAASSPPSAQTSTSVPCLSPNARSERMLTALASRAAVRRVILAGASPLINFTSSPAGRACMPFGAVIVTFPVVI